jgi:hypothetical protein
MTQKTIEVMLEIVTAARLVVQFDGTDRLSLDQLKESLENYDSWLLDGHN